MATIVCPLAQAAAVIESLNPTDPGLDGLCVLLGTPAQGTVAGVPYVAWDDSRSWAEPQMRTWIEARLTGITGASIGDAGLPVGWMGPGEVLAPLPAGAVT